MITCKRCQEIKEAEKRGADNMKEALRKEIQELHRKIPTFSSGIGKFIKQGWEPYQEALDHVLSSLSNIK